MGRQLTDVLLFGGDSLWLANAHLPVELKCPSAAENVGLSYASEELSSSALLEMPSRDLAVNLPPDG